MSDASRPVSLGKTGSAGSPGTGAAGGRPWTLPYLVGALAFSGVMAVFAAISLRAAGAAPYVHNSAEATVRRNEHRPRGALSAAQQASVERGMHTLLTAALYSNIILLLALLTLSYFTWQGRYWARWAVVIIWVVSTITGTLASAIYILSVGSGNPTPFRYLSFLAGLSFLAAVVLVNLPPTVAFLNLNRPVPAAGAPARRGLFAPRPPLRTDTTSPAPRGGTRGAGAAAGTPTSPAAARGNLSGAKNTPATPPSGTPAGATRPRGASKSRRVERRDGS